MNDIKKAALNTFTKAGIMLLVIAFLFLITWLLYSKFSNSSTASSGKATRNSPSLSILSDKKEFKTGEDLEAEISLQKVPKDITSFALRVICSWNGGGVPLGVQTDGKVLEIGSSLETKGWAFPVQQVKPLENSWQIDLAGVNLSGESLRENSLVLANLKFQAKSESSSLNCRFEPSSTKILTRSLADFEVDLNGFSFVISN